MLRSFIAAFSMYSRIPMPRIEWSESAVKYAMCFFPAVGIAVGAALFAAAYIMRRLGAGDILYSAVMTAIPVTLTGGIHMDGFIDVSDANASFGSREKRLEIMKDPNVGAFALIRTAVYFMLAFGIWSETAAADVPVIALGCVLSRTLSALSVITFPLAKGTGLAAMFSGAADKRRNAAALLCWLTLCAAMAIAADPVRGAAMFTAAGAVFLAYRITSVKRYGGITGDLAGWFLQLCELAVPAAVVFAGRFL